MPSEPQWSDAKAAAATELAVQTGRRPLACGPKWGHALDRDERAANSRRETPSDGVRQMGTFLAILAVSMRVCTMHGYDNA